MYNAAAYALLVAGLHTWMVLCQPQPGGGAGNESVRQEDNKIERRLQGKWTVVEASGSYGIVNEDEYGGKLSFDFDGDKLSSIQGGKTTDSRRFTIDTTHSPTWINAGAIKGIVRLEGDTLTICWGFKRPRGFDLAEGNIFEERYILKRVKPGSPD
ncbi:MAG TPA: TIGR03067 domain-containing protein [Planctomycetaceae bacterium]|jgi:uncharacterized protein (TIGR03067 family)|nr:TIGR03067 domain-containing protein [Planctomycetaceae bacterium]